MSSLIPWRRWWGRGEEEGAGGGRGAVLGGSSPHGTRHFLRTVSSLVTMAHLATEAADATVALSKG